MAYTPQSGVEGYMLLNGNNIAVDHFDVTFSCPTIEAPSFPGGDFMEYTRSKKRARATASGTWNKAYNPFSNGIKIGEFVTHEPHLNSSTFAGCLFCRVEDMVISNDSDQKADITITLVYDGPFDDFSGGLA